MLETVFDWISLPSRISYRDICEFFVDPMGRLETSLGGFFCLDGVAKHKFYSFRCNRGNDAQRRDTVILRSHGKLEAELKPELKDSVL